MKLHLIVLFSLCIVVNCLRAAQDEGENILAASLKSLTLDEGEKVDAASLNAKLAAFLNPKPLISNPNPARPKKRSLSEIRIHNAIAATFGEPKRRDTIEEFNRDIATAHAQAENCFSYQNSKNDTGDPYGGDIFTNYASYLEYQRYIKYGS